MSETRYPDRYPVTHEIGAILTDFEVLSAGTTPIAVAGRVMTIRGMGKVIFADIQDITGRIQLFVQAKELGEAEFEKFRETIRIGDIVGVSGVLFVTRTLERSVRAGSYRTLSKMLHHMPDKHHGLVDKEVRFRQRYLDLIMNQETRDVLVARSKMLREVRRFLDERNYLEVETPIIQSSPCGASANPFATHHDALNIDVYLRISPETYLKQLVVGGVNRVYEMGKNFRNEGLDPSHLQEFTMLEWYTAYWSYEELIPFVTELIQHLLLQTVGKLSISYQGEVLDFNGSWQKVEYVDLVESDCGINVLDYGDAQSMLDAIKTRGIDLGNVSPGISLGNLIDKLYKKVSRPKLIQPTFLLHHPSVLIPLARRNEQDPRVIDAFQVLVNGWEIVKAYSELADPQLQRKLLEEQSQQREGGDDEAMFLDESFLKSLEHGLPPVAGAGLGIDRLLAIATDSLSLRDIVMFPMMR